MLTIEPTGAVLGATIRGIDIAQPIDESDFSRILHALGHHGVLRFPDQQLDMGTLRQFSERFGEIQGPSSAPEVAQDPNAHVGTLSNLKENGSYIGSPDAGQDWHTDMSYRDVMGFVNVLYGIRIPRRTACRWAAPSSPTCTRRTMRCRSDIRTRLADATATHNFEKFWEHMRRDKASTRPPMTDEQQRAPPTGGASAVPDASDHRPEGAVLQPRLYHADQRTAASTKATRCWSTCSRISLNRAFATRTLDRERPAGLGPPRHHPSRDRRLCAGRNQADAPLPGDGDQGVRPRVPAPGARTGQAEA